MKVDRKDLFNYLSGVSILAQLHNLLVESPSHRSPLPLQQEDNLRSKKHADVELVVTGDMK
jgi:hypothetical protein